MTTCEFELRLETGPLTDEHEDVVLNGYDAVIGGHGPATLLILTAHGSSYVDAFRGAVTRLGEHGITVRRAAADTVTLAAAARRAGTAPEAAARWAQEAQASIDPFPEPLTRAGEDRWLWGEVNAWLARNGHPHDNIQHPSRADLDHCDEWLSRAHPSGKQSG